jgi:hypothetical protein
VLAAVLAVALLAPPALAGTLVLQAARDATLIESSDGSLANGAGPAFFVGRTSQSFGARRRAVLSFDVAGHLPGGAWVTSVELLLELTPSNAPVADVGLHRVLTPWSEGPSSASGGGGAPAEPGDATWLHSRYDAQRWMRPGGDFAPEPSSVARVGAAGRYVWRSTPDLASDVQGWLDAPRSNHGWILIGAEQAPTTSKRFASREEPTQTMQPRLVIEYQTGCEGAALAWRAFGLCHAYCEALDCDGPWPRASPRACSRLARSFARRTGGAPLPCALPDWDGDGVVDDADSCPWTANPDQADLDADERGDACSD